MQEYVRHRISQASEHLKELRSLTEHCTDGCGTFMCNKAFRTECCSLVCKACECMDRAYRADPEYFIGTFSIRPEDIADIEVNLLREYGPPDDDAAWKIVSEEMPAWEKEILQALGSPD